MCGFILVLVFVSIFQIGCGFLLFFLLCFILFDFYCFRFVCWGFFVVFLWFNVFGLLCGVVGERVKGWGGWGYVQGCWGSSVYCLGIGKLVVRLSCVGCVVLEGCVICCVILFQFCCSGNCKLICVLFVFVLQVSWFVRLILCLVQMRKFSEKQLSCMFLVWVGGKILKGVIGLFLFVFICV